MFIEQVPEFFRNLYPKALWRMDPNDKAVYLTFDDGPIPVITPWVVDLLARYNIKATFFMVGDNVHKFPQEYMQVVENGHRIGNHTFNHLKGLFTNTRKYIENVVIDRKEKNLFSNLSDGDKVSYYRASSGLDEVSFVVNKIKELMRSVIVGENGTGTRYDIEGYDMWVVNPSE